jgi:hypothetical protein
MIKKRIVKYNILTSGRVKVQKNEDNYVTNTWKIYIITIWIYGNQMIENETGIAYSTH